MATELHTDAEATPSPSPFTPGWGHNLLAGLLLAREWCQGAHMCFGPRLVSWLSCPDSLPCSPPLSTEKRSLLLIGFQVCPPSLQSRSALSCLCCITGGSSFHSTSLPLKPGISSVSSTYLMFHEYTILLSNPSGLLMWILSVLFLPMRRVYRPYICSLGSFGQWVRKKGDPRLVAQSLATLPPAVNVESRKRT